MLYCYPILSDDHASALDRFGLYLFAILADLRPSMLIYLGADLWLRQAYSFVMTQQPRRPTEGFDLGKSWSIVILATMYGQGQHDIRKRQRAQSSFSWQQQKEKSEKLSVQNKFIATLTHEIKNIVTK